MWETNKTGEWLAAKGEKEADRLVRMFMKTEVTQRTLKRTRDDKSRADKKSKTAVVSCSDERAMHLLCDPAQRQGRCRRRFRLL
eukprot:3529157-Rhodomonas_salina.2